MNNDEEIQEAFIKHMILLVDTATTQEQIEKMLDVLHNIMPHAHCEEEKAFYCELIVRLNNTQQCNALGR